MTNTLDKSTEQKQTTVVIFNNGLREEYGADFYNQLKKQVDNEIERTGTASTRQWFLDGMFNLNEISAIYIVKKED